MNKLNIAFHFFPFQARDSKKSFGKFNENIVICQRHMFVVGLKVREHKQRQESKRERIGGNDRFYVFFWLNVKAENKH
jgi:hypothetical protein